MDKVYKIDSEWDLGLYNTVFSSYEKAFEWIKNNYDYFGLEESLEDLLNEKLIVIKELKVL